jgi:hypothetical protein
MKDENSSGKHTFFSEHDHLRDQSINYNRQTVEEEKKE